MRARLFKRLIIAVSIVVSPLATGLDLSLPAMGEPANQVMTPSDEARLGARMMQEIRRHARLVEDPAVISYVEDLVQRLGSHAAGSAQGYQVFVIDNPRINAFAMPGGYIGVHSGLLLAARSESQFASVLAHEMAHVTQRHLARRMLDSRQTNLQTVAAILAGILIGSQNPQAGAAAAMSGMAGSIQQQLAYSRDHEREADWVGMQILADAAFDPAGMPEFFSRLLERSRYSDEPPPFLSTHPLTEERIADASARSDSLRPRREVFESPAFELIRGRLEALQFHDADEAVHTFRNRLRREDAAGGLAERYGLAVGLTRAGQAQQARQILRELISEAGDQALFYLALGEAAQALGQPAEAVAVYDEALTLFPDDYALRYRRIEALIETDADRQALLASAEAVRERDNAPELWRLRARAASAADDEPEAALAMARFYTIQGDLRGGLNQVKRVLADPGADPYQRSRASALQNEWQQELRSRAIR